MNVRTAWNGCTYEGEALVLSIQPMWVRVRIPQPGGKTKDLTISPSEIVP